MFDFRAILRLSWWDQVETGEPDEVAMLVDGLRMRPDSLFRATTFTRNPPPAAGEGRPELGWLGWDQTTALLLEIRNAFAGSRKALTGPPTATRQVTDGAPVAASPVEMLQQLRRR